MVVAVANSIAKEKRRGYHVGFRGGGERVA